MCIRDSNYPFVLAPGMGLNAYFTYTVVMGMGFSWQMALSAVFVEGIIFIVLSLTNVREAIFNAIPMNLKHAVSVGIGLFIAFIGLQNAKIVVDSSTLVTLFSFKSSIKNGTFQSEDVYKRQHGYALPRLHPVHPWTPIHRYRSHPHPLSLLPHLP